MDLLAQRLGFATLAPSVALLVALGLTACSDDGGGETDGESTSEGGTTAGESAGTTGGGTDGTSDTGTDAASEDPGTVILRRLNNVEYNNTIQDLIGTEQTPADNFPADQVSLGFDNISAVQNLAPPQAELYELAAESVIEEAMDRPMVEPQLQLFQAETDETTKDAGGEAGEFWNLWSNGEVMTSVTVEHDGPYMFRTRAAGQQAGPDLPHMLLKVDGLEVAGFDVEATQQAPQQYEAEVELTAGVHTIAVEFTNDYYDMVLMEDRNLLVDYLELEGPFGLEGEENPLRDNILICDPGPAGDQACLQQIIEHFGRRAYRRPLSADELDRLMALLSATSEDAADWETGLKTALKALLVSPHFLFRVELDANPQDETPHPVGPFELATRLSYFIWSSMPDDELLDAAAAGELESEAQIVAQVTRMLNDERAQALVDNYAGQWLLIRAIWDAFKDPSVFPQMNDALRQSMVTEMSLFAESMLLDDRPLTELLLAKSSFLDDAMAQHYGLPPTGSDQFQEIDFGDAPRQGVLTQAGLLVVLSHATHNSPVKRGKWVLENILCEEPPPPPDNLDIPPLEPVEDGGSLREQLEQHVSDPVCASCHQYMDPPGFALEHYDALGAWRADDHGYAIDATGQLMSGAQFDGAIELSDALAVENGFPRCLTEKAFIYALGREVRVPDDPYIQEIQSRLELADYSFTELVLALTTSDSFRMRRGEQE